MAMSMCLASARSETADLAESTNASQSALARVGIGEGVMVGPWVLSESVIGRIGRRMKGDVVDGVCVVGAGWAWSGA